MAIKSKNINANPKLRIAALVLAAVMFLASGGFASLFVQGFANYASENGTPAYTSTPAFRWLMNTCIREIYNSSSYMNIYSVEEFEATARGQEISSYYIDRSKLITDSYDLLDKSAIKVYRDAQNRYRYSLANGGFKYYFSYDGDFITSENFKSMGLVEVADYASVPESTKPATPPVSGTVPFTETSTKVTVEIKTTARDQGAYDPHEGGNAPDSVINISRALGNIYHTFDSYCYGEMTKDEMLAELERQRQDALLSDYEGTFNWQFRKNSFKNVNYALIFSSGRVVSNCGVTAKDTSEQILKKLDSEVFIEARENGKYTLYEGKPVIESESNSIFTMLRSWLFGNKAFESVLEGKDYILGEDLKASYFALPICEEIDAFVVSERSYSTFRNTHLTSLTLLIALWAISFAIACAAAIYLMRTAGVTENGIKLNFFDKIPAEINFVLTMAIMAGLAALVVLGICNDFDPSSFTYRMGAQASQVTFNIVYRLSGFVPLIFGLFHALFFILWTGLNMSFIRNVRNKSFFKHTLVYFCMKPIIWVGKKLKNVLNKLKEKIKFILDFEYPSADSKRFKIILCTAAVLFVLITSLYYWLSGVIIANDDAGFLLAFLGILGDAAIIAGLLIIVSSYIKIAQAVSAIRKGELNTEIDTKYMPKFMKKFADDILGVQDGLQNAVESAVKDQRMKAELITNVSHDLKTPLTSIVSYVDLLKKCEVQDETAQKYINVLDEKAAKMKKLIEDLVEASKASTGAVEIHPVKINLCEFAAQAVGEHEDELKKYGIELVLRAPEQPVIVWADSQKTSRIVENLFSNIRKYAMEGTRAYIEVFGGEDYGTLTFKNISKNVIEVNPDELTHRFVRGDSSRSGEGSGLGLSIAQNLCELQKGKFKVSVDGDLFKVTLALPNK